MTPRKFLAVLQSRLQIRLILVTLCIAIPLLTSILALTVLEAERQMRHDADERLRMSNRILAANISTWTTLNSQALKFLVAQPDIMSMDAGRQKPVLESMHQAYPYMYLISTTDLNGMNLARSDEADPMDYSDRYWFQKAKEGQLFSYQTLIGRTTGLPALVVSTPIRNSLGETTGIAMFAADLASITREVQATTIGDTGFTYIIDSNNLAVADPKADYSTGTLPDMSNESPVKRLRSGSDGIMTFTDKDGHRWRAYVANLSNGWGVIIQQREDEVLEPIRQFSQLAWISLLIGLVALVGLLWVLIGRSLRAIGLLTQTATAIAGGELNRTVNVQRRDEVGVLASAFNSMTAQLRDLINSLEARVKARTRDIELGAEVSREITTVLDISDLLDRVTVLTAQSFNFYVVYVFLLDSEGQKLVRAAGATAASGAFKDSQEETISLNAEPSIIALAARTQKLVLINDVSTSPHFLRFESLPDTRSELTIPMLLGDKLMGVVDLQADTVDRFKDEDVRILTALAEQITIAVRNAQLYSEATIARQEAERSNRVKSQFLASMSHELRTPLNAILNFTQFVASGMMGPVNERQATALKKTVASGEHLLSLINDVLDISKIEANALQLFVEDNINVKQELEAAVETGKSLLAEKPIDLGIHVEGELPNIRGDRQRIYQIFLNLISNACKFTESGSVTINACRQNDHILVTIRDTGPGISPEDQGVIFEAFRQSHAGLQKGGGTGLGLPISKRLAEAHGGSLWVESAVGQGATFYVSLPVQAACLQLTQS